MPRDGYQRPAPEEFAAVAWAHGLKTLSRMFNAGQVVIQRWRDELGEDPRKAIETPPADFRLKARQLNKTSLQAHYGVGERRINNWLDRCGIIEVPRNYPTRPMPADFHEIAPTLNQAALTRHYRADVSTVKRWCDEANVAPAAADYSWVAERNRARTGHTSWRGPVVRYDVRSISMYDEAADTLRRERFVVHRCDDRGRYCEKGDFWRSGNTLLTPDELLQRADKYRVRAA